MALSVKGISFSDGILASISLQGFSFDCRIRVSPIVTWHGSVYSCFRVAMDVRNAHAVICMRSQ